MATYPSRATNEMAPDRTSVIVEKALASGARNAKLRFSLNNRDLVMQIMDRGESLYRKDNGSPRKTIKDVSKIPDVIATIQVKLDEAKTSCAMDPSKSFIPRDAFDRILTPSRVLQIVSELKCFQGLGAEEQNDKAQDICFGSEPDSKLGFRAPCLKLMGALIGMDKAEDIGKHMSEGLTDDCLPLQPKLTEKHILICRHHKEGHKAMNNYRRPYTREQFTRWTRTLMAPYIKWERKKHAHYVMETGDCFPLQIVARVQDEDDDNSKNNDTAQSKDSTKYGYGGYSEVYKVKVEPSHGSFGKHEAKEFGLELASLLFCSEKDDGETSNLIQLLATFEELNCASGQRTFYLLFDWAEGNLSKFWRSNPHLVGDMTHCPWMVEQFYQLVCALKTFHNERTENMRHIKHTADSDSNLYGRHGDIKPGNILWFPRRTNEVLDNDELGKLTLADFGLGRLHSRISRSKQNPESIPRTATYRAPEFDLKENNISQQCDIYSLGCVFLEYITWFLLGLDSLLNEFPRILSEPDIYGFDADVFFRIKPDENDKRTAQWKPQVREWIQKLRDHEKSSWPIVQLLDLIDKEMLHPDPQKRIRSWRLHKKLITILRTCQQSESFYMKPVREGKECILTLSSIIFIWPFKNKNVLAPGKKPLSICARLYLYRLQWFRKAENISILLGLASS
ncbi:kinase-like domain-containing protein [Bombardia bombarda]|uniref:Kinase-like domain-containing protein n=1 Tax=Bombardia bombarda TaxID=252184 RepID=A0AA39XBM0_9PEZI|nr:kinase-like domain-containing protein [Bombardia bombarda]